MPTTPSSRPQASFTLSHRRMITGDISDNGSGDFLAALLTAGAAGQAQPAADLIETLLEDDTDPWTMIGWPMLGLGDENGTRRWVRCALVRAERAMPLLGHATAAGSSLVRHPP